jgi:hypothetical protein
VFHSLEFGESDGTVVSVGINPPKCRNSMRYGSLTFFGTFGVEVEFVIVTIDSGIHSYFPFVVEIFSDLDRPRPDSHIQLSMIIRRFRQGSYYLGFGRDPFRAKRASLSGFSLLPDRNVFESY